MIDSPYHWIKAFHIIAVISWMAGMLYLPRLFVYHCRVSPGSEASELFKVMEHRLMRFIMAPSLTLVWFLGLWLVWFTNALNPVNGTWMHWKLTLVFAMSGLHGLFAKYRKAFARDERPKSEKYFRILNEVPAVLMVIIVILVVVRPF